MLLSLNWLTDHVDLSGIDAGSIAEELTRRTALIEGFHDQRKALAGVVVGKVLECVRHPAADKLSCCVVDDGSGEAHRVVCGAPNVAVGQSIAYAPVGITLPNGMKLKQAKIRGEASAGMICAEDELGLGPEHDGILVLAGSLEAGTPVSQLDGLADVIFEIDNKSITHRADLWGHRGFARELASIFGRPLRPLSLDETLSAGPEGPAVVRQPESGCGLYAALAMEAEPSRSPDWLRFRLVACGMRPINLVVDLSNYVMLELGQPMHPFDMDRISGGTVVARRARSGEVLRTLDGVERTLAERDVVIGDAERAVAIAGIMGSAVAEVSTETRRVLLESAHFDAAAVRRTSSRLGLRTEALARFEKGLDPSLVEQAVRRYAHLLGSLAPRARVSRHYTLDGSARAPSRVIRLSTDMVRRRLGLDASDDAMAQVLESIGFQCSKESGALRVTVPSWRATRDVTIPEDLVEEVGRLLGYERIEVVTPVAPLIVAEREPAREVEERLRDLLGGSAACTEVYSYSTIRNRTLDLTQVQLAQGHARLKNALQQDAAFLRPSLVPELFMRLEDWLRHEPEARLFEIGRSYSIGADGALIEAREAAVVLARRETGDERIQIRQMRGVVEEALRHCGRARPRLRLDESGRSSTWAHPARTADVVLGEGSQVVGQVGAIDPGLKERLGLDAAVAWCVLDTQRIASASLVRAAYQPVPTHPAAHLDLAFVVSYDVTTDELIDAIRAAGPRTLGSVTPFDVYRGGRLAEGERSIAFHLTFQAPDRTLSDDVLLKARDRIVKALEALHARLR